MISPITPVVEWTRHRSRLPGLLDETLRRSEGVPDRVEYMDDRSFADPATEERLWGPDREEIVVPAFRALPEFLDESPAPAVSRAPLTARHEQTLFLRYNHAKYQMARLLASQRRRPAAGRAREIGLWHQRAREVRTQIVHANLALVRTMANRVKTAHVEFDDLVAEGYMVVLKAIEKFDVSRGFKFSTYACRSILARFHRMMTVARRAHERFPVQFDPELERCDPSQRRHDEQQADAIQAVRDILTRNWADLDRLEQTVVQQRFPMTPEWKRRTLAEVGRLVGLSCESVRKIERRCLRKVRAALEEHFAA